MGVVVKWVKWADLDDAQKDIFINCIAVCLQSFFGENGTLFKDRNQRFWQVKMEGQRLTVMGHLYNGKITPIFPFSYKEIMDNIMGEGYQGVLDGPVSLGMFEKKGVFQQVMDRVANLNNIRVEGNYVYRVEE